LEIDEKSLTKYLGCCCFLRLYSKPVEYAEHAVGQVQSSTLEYVPGQWVTLSFRLN